MSATGAIKAVESDALIESSFRRLLSAIETEREKIRGTWQQIQQERDGTTSELDRLRQDTDDWCMAERLKIAAEWKRFDRLTEQMNDMWPPSTDVIEINCSGRHFTLARQTLCGIEGSVLAHMFTDLNQEIPRDEFGRYYFDFNPDCFSILIEYLRNRRLRVDAPLPVVPVAQQENMELLAQAWNLTPFLYENKVNPVHGTSLHVTPVNNLKATHPGWQLISAERPLPKAGHAYFEAKIVANPDPRGGLAIGICNHIPTGSEVHTIRLTGSVLYNSSNGIIGDCIETAEVEKGIQFSQGQTFGIKHDYTTRELFWFHNRKYIGKSVFKDDWLDRMQTLYPVFGLYIPDQAIRVDFTSPIPAIDD